jgi:RNA polymerase sigma factor (sigma-70 family)
MSSERRIPAEERLSAAVLRELPIAALVTYVNSGDEDTTSDAFAEIVRRFEPLLRKTWQAHGRGEYRDFAHDVFVRIFAALPGLKTGPAFPSFFRSIVLSVAADQWRKRRPEQVDVDEKTLEELASNIDNVLMTRLIVRSYLEYLTEHEQNVLGWELIDGRSTREIAGELGITPGAVRTIRSRAREKLRAVIERDEAMLERIRKK